jgi:hypothetical protein
VLTAFPRWRVGTRKKFLLFAVEIRKPGVVMANNLYETDFYTWAMYHAQLLKQRQFEQLDLHHLVEEVESMGISERKELLSRLEELLMHLLKWQYQSDKRTPSWYHSISNQRIAIEIVLLESPSLQYQLEERMLKAYSLARRHAALETKLPITTFSETCPYTLEQVLNSEWLPKND